MRCKGNVFESKNVLSWCRDLLGYSWPITHSTALMKSFQSSILFGRIQLLDSIWSFLIWTLVEWPVSAYLIFIKLTALFKNRYYAFSLRVRKTVLICQVLWLKSLNEDSLIVWIIVAINNKPIPEPIKAGQYCLFYVQWPIQAFSVRTCKSTYLTGC